MRLSAKCNGIHERIRRNDRIGYHMDLHRMIAELQEERSRIDEAIEALERLSAGKARRRGRPPAWLREEMADSQPADEPASPPPKPGKLKH